MLVGCTPAQHGRAFGGNGGGGGLLYVSIVMPTCNNITWDRKRHTLIILWFSKLVASDQHGLVMLSLGYLIYVPSMCQL